MLSILYRKSKPCPGEVHAASPIFVRLWGWGKYNDRSAGAASPSKHKFSSGFMRISVRSGPAARGLVPARDPAQGTSRNLKERQGASRKTSSKTARQENRQEMSRNVKERFLEGVPLKEASKSLKEPQGASRSLKKTQEKSRNLKEI